METYVSLEVIDHRMEVVQGRHKFPWSHRPQNGGCSAETYVSLENIDHRMEVVQGRHKFILES